MILNGYCLYTSLINGLQAVVYIANSELGLSSLAYADWMNDGAYIAVGLIVTTHVTYFVFENFVFENALRHAKEIFLLNYFIFTF